MKQSMKAVFNGLLQSEADNGVVLQFVFTMEMLVKIYLFGVV